MFVVETNCHSGVANNVVGGPRKGPCPIAVKLRSVATLHNSSCSSLRMRPLQGTNSRDNTPRAYDYTVAFVMESRLCKAERVDGGALYYDQIRHIHSTEGFDYALVICIRQRKRWVTFLPTDSFKKTEVYLHIKYFPSNPKTNINLTSFSRNYLVSCCITHSSGTKSGPSLTSHR